MSDHSEQIELESQKMTAKAFSLRVNKEINELALVVEKQFKCINTLQHIIEHQQEEIKEIKSFINNELKNTLKIIEESQSLINREILKHNGDINYMRKEMNIVKTRTCENSESISELFLRMNDIDVKLE